MRAAFYKGTRGGLAGVFNRVGRFLDRGPYSHTELVMSNGVSWSSSFEDGGVRHKLIAFRAERWDFIDVPKRLEADAHRWFVAHQGQKYDLWGNVRFFCGLASDSPDRWFCSESNMAALGSLEPFRYGPNGMAVWMLEQILAGNWAVPWPRGIALLNHPRYAHLNPKGQP